VFDRWRYPAAFAVAVGIGFPALAAAAGGSHAPARLQAKFEHRVERARPNALTRPAKRLRKTIYVQMREIRVEQRRKREQRFAHLPGGTSQVTLDAIGQCESGGDPSAVSADGTYRGKYQFDYGTWASVGGNGDPAAAPEKEQDYRAALLYVRSGSSPWPVCG
jgi:hypothetical protein